MKKCIKVLVCSGVAFLLFAQSAYGEEGTNGGGQNHQDHLPDEEINEEGYCAPYNGKICKSLIVSPRSVW